MTANEASDPCGQFKIGYVDRYIPVTLYRWVDREEIANELASGTVRLTTLEICRRMENDKARGDPFDGRQAYMADHLAGHGDDARFRARAVRASVGVGPESRDITIRRSISEERIPDAWLISTTDRFDPAMAQHFGRFCIRIKEPQTFFKRVTRRLCQEQRIAPPALLGRVTYANPVTSGDEAQGGQTGFVKAPDRYGYQTEVRMLFTPKPGMKVDRHILADVVDPTIMERIT